MHLTYNERLQKAASYFTEETKLMSGLTMACGSDSQAFFACTGTRDGSQPMTPETLCDLASMTKIFTGMSALRLKELGELDLEAPITRYAPEFVNLSGVTVNETLGFEKCLVTPARVDDAVDAEEARRSLCAIAPKPFPGTRFYSDMPAIVIGVVLEKVTGCTLADVFRELIFDPLGLKDIYAQVPPERLNDCALYDREHRIERERYIVREGVGRGMPHDPKARILGCGGKYLTGHAGLFASVGTMADFCRAVLDGRLLSRESLAFMAKNRLGRPLPEGGWAQYLGTLCYVKHPNQYDSEVPAFMSAETIAMGGFTGNHLSIDPVTGCWVVILGNRCLNRLSVLLPEAGRTRESYGLNPDGTGTVVWPDGEVVQSSVNWVHHKDAHIHNVIAQELGFGC